jgi:hypothetical protein
MTNYKSLVPAVVAAGVLLYEAVTGHHVSTSIQNTITNDVIAALGFGFTVWGIWKNHKK